MAGRPEIVGAVFVVGMVGVSGAVGGVVVVTGASLVEAEDGVLVTESPDGEFSETAAPPPQAVTKTARAPIAIALARAPVSKFLLIPIFPLPVGCAHALSKTDMG